MKPGGFPLILSACNFHYLSIKPRLSDHVVGLSNIYRKVIAIAIAYHYNGQQQKLTLVMSSVDKTKISVFRVASVFLEMNQCNYRLRSHDIVRRVSTPS